jgi:hypothetical protein
MTCATNPPSPDGFRIWRGPVPPPLVDWAVYLRDLEIGNVPYGFTWWMDYTDPKTSQSQYVLARKDHHPYTYKNGKLVTGICIPGITLYSQIPTAAQTSYVASTDTLDVPDPNAATFSVDEGINWPLVAASGAAGAGVVLLFWLALKGAGQAAKPKKLRRAA